MKRLKLKNVASIHELQFSVPEDGGVVVLRGRNGVGKSHALNAVQNAITGRGKPPIRDNCKSAEVDAFGVSLTVGRSSRRQGELEVETLDGKLSIADLAEPAFKDPGASDGVRIKALVSLSNVAPSPDLFVDCVGGKETFNMIATQATLAKTNLVDMAEAFKRDVEAWARRVADEAERTAEQSRALRAAAEQVDMSVETDPAKLDERYTSAILARGRLVERSDAFTAHWAKVEQLKSNVSRLEYVDDGVYDGAVEALRVARLDVEAKERRRNEALNELDDLRQRLRVAEENAKAHFAAWETSIERAKACGSRLETLQQRRDMDNAIRELEASTPPDVTDDERQLAQQAIADAQRAIEDGARARDAVESLRKADLLFERANERRKFADMLRNAAKGVDEVLSDVVQRCKSPLWVEGGRLLVRHPERGPTFFHELSPGERWTIALEIAAHVVGDRGLIVVPQEAWEGLDPINRDAIAKSAKRLRVLVLTACCDSNAEIEVETL